MQDDKSSEMNYTNRTEAQYSTALGQAAIAGAAAAPFVSAAAGSGLFNSIMGELSGDIPLPSFVSAPFEQMTLALESKPQACVPVREDNDALHSQPVVKAAHTDITFNGPDAQHGARPMIQPFMKSVKTVKQQPLRGPAGSVNSRTEFTYENNADGGRGEIIEHRDAQAKTKTTFTESNNGRQAIASADQKFEGDGYKVVRQEASGKSTGAGWSNQFHTSFTMTRAGEPDFHGMQVAGGQSGRAPSAAVKDRATRKDFWHSGDEGLDKSFEPVDRMINEMRHSARTWQALPWRKESKALPSSKGVSHVNSPAVGWEKTRTAKDTSDAEADRDDSPTRRPARTTSGVSNGVDNRDDSPTRRVSATTSSGDAKNTADRASADRDDSSGRKGPKSKADEESGTDESDDDM